MTYSEERETNMVGPCDQHTAVCERLARIETKLDDLPAAVASVVAKATPPAPPAPGFDLAQWVKVIGLALAIIAGTLGVKSAVDSPTPNPAPVVQPR